MCLIGEQDLAAEDSLMQALFGEPLDIPSRVLVHGRTGSDQPLSRVEGKCELEVRGVVTDDPNWIERLIEPRSHSNKPDERQVLLVGTAQRHVLRMVRIGASVLVPLQTVRTDRVVVRRDL